jgi:hypothetical protein
MSVGLKLTSSAGKLNYKFLWISFRSVFSKSDDFVVWLSIC